jgi:hypothetical protein
MSQKIAVLLVHGIERHKLDDLDMLTHKREMMRLLKTEFARQVQVDADDALAFETCIWTVETGMHTRSLDFMQMMEDSRVTMGTLREFVMDILHMTSAYQSHHHDRQTYTDIHSSMGLAIQRLAQAAGDQAPLIVIAHSLGAVITSHYFYDLQWDSPKRPLIPAPLRGVIGSTPIQRGHTLTSVFTLGNPLALWNLRFEHFGTPMIVPAPELKNHYPKLKGKWINLYDKDDPLAYPLRPLSVEYEKLVQDIEINAGGLFDSWNPASHLAYWTDMDVVKHVTQALHETWKTINE